MSSTIFSDMLRKAQMAGQVATNDGPANKWFRDKAKEVKKAQTESIMREATDRYGTQLFPGHMVMFYYDPKHKADLPYYDLWPLIFPLEIKKDHILGINFHYLQPSLRAKLMDALYDKVHSKKLNDNTKMKIAYEILASASRYKLFKPCIKKYLKTHIRSKFVKVQPQEWDFALMLPTDRFVKATNTKVWAESRKIIAGTK